MNRDLRGVIATILIALLAASTTALTAQAQRVAAEKTADNSLPRHRLII